MQHEESVSLGMLHRQIGILANAEFLFRPRPKAQLALSSGIWRPNTDVVVHENQPIKGIVRFRRRRRESSPPN
jgi:hypothetical protein